MAEIVILGWTDFEPGHRERWMAHVDALVEASRQEPGVLRYVVLADPKSPTAVVAHEHYADADALEAHRASAHLAEFKAATNGCQIRAHDIVKIEGTTMS